MNNFSFGYAEDLKNGCNSHGEAIILNPSRRDTTIIHYSIFMIHSLQQRDKLKFGHYHHIQQIAVTEVGHGDGCFYLPKRVLSLKIPRTAR